MKKIILALAFFCILVPDTFAQTDNMVSLKGYSSFFTGPSGGALRTYTRVASNSDVDRIAALGGASTTRLDTALEIALLSRAAGVIDIRPVAASEMFDDARQEDLTFGAWVFQEIQILRFLGNTAAVGRYEAELQHGIISRGNVTRADVEAFYRNGIRGLISEVVDEEFNRISFLVENYSTNSRFSYNAVLTRNPHPQTGEYTLSYERPDIPNSGKTLSAPSLEALSSAMRNSGDFVPAAINTVRAQAALIPAAALSDAALNEIITILTNFYITPGATTYNAARDVYTVYRNNYINSNRELFRIARDAYGDVLNSLNMGLAQKVENEANRAQISLSAAQQRTLVSLRTAGAAAEVTRG